MSTLRQIRLGDSAKVLSGYAFKSEHFTTEGVPVIKIANIKNGSVVFDSETECLPETMSGLVHSRFRVRRGDILISLTGSHMTQPNSVVGRVAQYKESFESWLNQRAGKVVIPTESELDNDYLYYLLSTDAARQEIALLAHGAANQANVSPRDIEKLKLNILPKPEQTKVAAILSAYDELIENKQRRIALLEKLAEEIYREWFVRLRFPGHAKTRVVKGVPQGWELVKLENAFKFTGGGTPSKEVDRYWNGGDVNWFTPSDITGADGIFLEKSGDQCTEEGFNNSSARMFPAYSVMLTSRATIGAIGINTTPACTNQGFITCIPNTRYPLPYLFHWIRLAKPHFELLAGGATFAELTKGTFKRIEILTPPEPIAAEFAQIESPLFQTIETLLRANRTLLKTRDKLLPRLISGKLSVENLDIQFLPGMAEELNAEPTGGSP